MPHSSLPIVSLFASALMFASFSAQADEPLVPSPEAQRTAAEAVVAVQAPVVAPPAPPAIVEVPLGGSGPTVLVAVKPTPKPQPAPDKDKVSFFGKFHAGFGLDVGVPSGIAVGFVFTPWVDWARFDVSFNENVLAPGGRGSLQLDPLAVFHRLPIGVFADFQYGGFANGTVPGHSTTLPGFGYTYESILGGIRLGKPNGFHWNFEIGASHLNISTTNFQSVINNSSLTGLTIGNPSASAWLTPAFETGFAIVW